MLNAPPLYRTMLRLNSTSSTVAHGFSPLEFRGVNTTA
jgi:hypothetical protein